MRMRVTVMFALVLAVCAVFGLAAGCSRKPATPNGSGDAKATLAAFKAWFTGNYDKEEWFKQASTIALETRLRKPTVLVFVDLQSHVFANEGNEVVNAWANSERGREVGLRMVSSDGFIYSGMPLFMELAGQVPPSPASAPEFMTWLDSAFGPASGNPVNEKWYGRIKSADFNAARQAIEVKTDLDFSSPADRELGDIIAQVIMLAKPQGVSNWIVRFGDGSMEQSGGF